MRGRTRTAVAGAVILLPFVIILVAGTIVRTRDRRELRTSAERAASAVPQVAVIRPQAARTSTLTIDGTTQGIQETVIYARTSGYIRRRYVDIGQRVTAGQLLAEIESPEVDQQLHQARADLNQAEKTLELQKATMDLARTTMARYQAADAENAVAKEAVDQNVSAFRTAQAAVAAAEATVASNLANVRRLEELTAFERVLAPSAGIVTQRNVDAGALITAGSPTNNAAASPQAAGAANGLFEISRVDTLRVFINVPQAEAGSVSVGLPVTVRVRGRPAPVTGRVTRTAGAIDPTTRTLLAEVDIPNASGELLPGMFVSVDFRIAPAGTRSVLPASAVIIDAAGTRVLTVAADGTLRSVPVVLGRDYGPEMEIQRGLTGDERIVRQPTLSLRPGQRVQPVEAAR